MKDAASAQKAGALLKAADPKIEGVKIIRRGDDEYLIGMTLETRKDADKVKAYREFKKVLSGLFMEGGKKKAKAGNDD